MNSDKFSEKRPKIIGVEWNRPNYTDIQRIYLKANVEMTKRHREAMRIWNNPGFYGSHFEEITDKIEKLLEDAVACGSIGITELLDVEGPGKKYAEDLSKKLMKPLEEVLKDYREVLNLNAYKSGRAYLFN